MESHDWLNYVGAFGGLVGAASGIGGLVLAILAFHRTGQFKALDLRLELRRCERSLRSDATNLAQFLESAKSSHTNLSAAQGTYNSGAMQQWLAVWSADFETAKALAKQVAALSIADNDMSQAKLEARLHVVQDLQHRVATLAGKYHETLAKDEAGRIELRADHRAVIQARTQAKS